MQAWADAHAKQAREEMERVGMVMADRAKQMSSPAYGVLIDGKAVPTSAGVNVVIDVKSAAAALGKVHGGPDAAMKAAQDAMDKIASEAGLDRRG